MNGAIKDNVEEDGNNKMCAWTLHMLNQSKNIVLSYMGGCV